MEQCVCCGKEGGADLIRRCSACKVTAYCSRDCQKQHWAQHKAFCRTAKHKSVPSQGSMQHTDDGETGTEEGSSVDCLVLTCQKCGIQRAVMDKCGSCLQVTYCSRDCQRADWKMHRVICHRKDNVTDTRQTGKADKKKSRAQNSGQAESSLTSALSKVTLTSDMTSDWEEVKARAGDLFPAHRIVDKISQLNTDFMGRVRKEKVVAVLKITTLYPHFLRQGRCLEDAEGRSSFVLFHTPDNPRPHFSYDQLREGNFLCFQHAFMHLFSDGTVGLRIDEAREVRILEPSSKNSKFGSTSLPTTCHQQWESAMHRAQTVFPHQHIVDSLNSIVHQDLKSFNTVMFFHIPTMTANKTSPAEVEAGEIRETLLLQLQAPIPHPNICHWVVKDRTGHCAELHMDFPQMWSPHFRMEDLRKGNFVCVSQPRISKQCDLYDIFISDMNRVGIIGQ